MKNSAEFCKGIKPDHLTIFPSQKIQLQPPKLFIVKRKVRFGLSKKTDP